VFSNIVVGTDGSDTAAAAVALAVELARDQGAKLHLVIGVHSPAAVAVPAGAANVSAPSGESHLQAVAQQMLKDVVGDVAGLETEIHTGVGDPADVIISTADRVGADLIVVGSKGLRGTRRILGSVPNSVAHKAGCHVLIARTT
jgi:nucleotide-binding universal stress UspA family protein